MKKSIAICLALILLLGLCACGTNEAVTTAPTSNEPASTAGKESAPTRSNIPKTTEHTDSQQEDLVLRVYSLKGPTSMGLAFLLDRNEKGETLNRYDSTICTGADEVTAALSNGDADIALLPANAASALYNKIGGFSVVAITTLGVLYVVENGESIQSVEDLAGKTICLTGKGTTPEYALRYILAAHGIQDQVTLEFKSEAQEVVAAMAEDAAMIGLLPQPFVTAAMMQNDQLRIALDLTEAWREVASDSILVTGVTVVRNEVLEQHPEAVENFLQDAAASVNSVNEDPAAAAELIVNMGVVAKAPIAQRAIPYCNLVCITGTEMKTLLNGYLKTLQDGNSKAVGGNLPNDSFYYTGE